LPNATSGGDAASTITLGAFDARVGADAALGPGRLGLEVGYLYAPRAQAAISGNFGGLTITAGYRVGL